MANSELPTVYSRQQTAIVVEDEEVIRMMAVSVLEGMGFKVFEAANAEDAREILAKNPIDLGWFDNNVPSREGQAVDLKKNEGAALLLESKRPRNCILSTGHGTTDDFKVPADVYHLAKPATMAQAEQSVTAVYRQNGFALNTNAEQEKETAGFTSRINSNGSLKPETFLPAPITWNDKTVVLIRPDPRMDALQTAWLQGLGVDPNNIRYCRDIEEASREISHFGGHVDVVVSSDRVPSKGAGKAFFQENDEKIQLKVLLTGSPDETSRRIPGASNSYIISTPCNRGDFQQVLTGAAEIASRTGALAER